MTKTVLVTGAAGFIGSHAAEEFLARGDTVVGLDNVNDYYDPARKRTNLLEVREGAPDPARFTLIEEDIRDRDLLAGLFAEHDFDAVVHLAAMAGVRGSAGTTSMVFSLSMIVSLREIHRGDQAFINGLLGRARG